MVATATAAFTTATTAATTATTAATTAATSATMVSAVSIGVASSISILICAVLLTVVVSKTLLDSYSSDPKYKMTATAGYAREVADQSYAILIPLALIFLMYTLTLVLPL